jgi:hypothetical protein
VCTLPTLCGYKNRGTTTVLTQAESKVSLGDMAPSFSITFAAAEESTNKSRLHPSDRATTRTPSRFLRLLNDHHPWELMNNTALIIVDQTYAALLELLGPAAPPPSANGHVEISRPLDPADPDSPLLSVNASATHCCICLLNSLHGGTTPEYKAHTSEKQKGRPHYSLASANVSVSPGTLHVRRATDCGRAPANGWRCADVRPNVAEKGVFGILETIRNRLDAAIRVEESLIEMARVSGCNNSTKINQIIDVRIVLEKMRGELELDAIIRRRRQKRRRRCEVQEICSTPDANMVDEADDAPSKKLRALQVSQNQKRCRPPAEMDQVDDADVLTKRLRALQV